jgi:hypothetical protein
MEVMTMEEVTGCPPKSPIGPMVTVEPGSIAESVVVGVITIVAIWGVRILITVGISIARANRVAVTGATIQASGHCPEQEQKKETSRETPLEIGLEHHRPNSD